MNNEGSQEAGDAALSAGMVECKVTVEEEEKGIADGGVGDPGNLAAGIGGVL